MNWQAIGVCSAIVLAISSGVGLVIRALVKKYCDSLEARITNLETKYDAFQKEMLKSLKNIELELKEINIKTSQYITLDKHIVFDRDLKSDIIDDVRETEDRLTRRIDKLDK